MKAVSMLLGLFLVVSVVTISGCSDNSPHTYYVGNSTFQLQGEWGQVYAINATVMSRVKLDNSARYLQVVKYNDQEQYLLDYAKAKEHYAVNTTEISGIRVIGINTGINKFLYYFEKNGQGYSVDTEGFTENNVMKDLDNIISTLT